MWDKRAHVHRSYDAALLVWLVGIVYGSLIPFHFHPYSIGEAWRAFLKTPWLDLGEADRADWVANLLLYMPASFLLASVLAARLPRVRWSVGVAVVAALSCCLLAVAVEFVQVFFPGRTVSLNDIAAEVIGSVLGAALWLAVGRRLLGLVETMRGQGPHALNALLVCYMLAYLALSLYPYNFLVSGQEFAAKLASGTYGLFLAPKGCSGTVQCGIKLAAEVLAVVPFGVWFRLKWRGDIARGLGASAVIGAVLGVVVEAAQFMIASGISQGVSVITRALGLACGYYVCNVLRDQGIGRFRPWLRPAVMALSVPYLILLLFANGVHLSHLLSWREALARLDEINYLPFYYYYFTSESHAMISLLAVAGLYAPIGVAAELWSITTTRSKSKAPWQVALSAGAVCALFEFAKLFSASKHPDPSDVLIAGVAAMTAFAGLRMLLSWLHPVVAMQMGRETAETSGASDTLETGGIPCSIPTASNENETVTRRVAPVPGGEFRPAVAWPSAWASVVAVAALAAAVYAVYRYPLSPFLLGAGLIAYGVLIWYRPCLCLVLVPALLPVLDFRPWSGWLFVTEFDLLVLVTLGVGYLRFGRSGTPLALEKKTVFLLALLTLSYAVSMVIGLLPMQPIGENAFSTYLSHYNSLRVAKGFFAALLMLPLLKGMAEENPNAFRKQLTNGILIGLSALVVLVLWERFLFPGLFNFSNNYRVTALFAGMQTGGPQVESYISLTVAFVVIWFLQHPSPKRLVVSLGLYAGAAYAMLVTFSRAGYLALAVVTCLIALSAMNSFRVDKRWRWAFLGTLVLVLIGVGTPIVKGSFSESRFAAAGKDFGLRLAHWREDMHMRDPGFVARGFGMGLGSFPATYYLKNKDGVRPGNFSFQRAGSNVFLRLGSGDSLYMGQRVSIEPHRRYRLAFDIRRRSSKNGMFVVFLCEKQLLYSFRCARSQIWLGSGAGHWEHRDLTLDSGNVGSGAWYARRPVELSLRNGTAGSLIDVDDVKLIGPEGKDHVVNGSFSEGSAHWFFTTDDGWPWRIENVWLQILFEQGWFGVLAFSALVLFTAARLSARSLLGDVFAAGLLSSIVGVLTIGLFSSSFVSSRIMFLFYMSLFVSEIHLSLAGRRMGGVGRAA